MVKPELGVKRTCPSCGARFYDLLKSPVECPKCEHTFDPEVLLKPRRARPEERKVAAQVVEEEELEVEEGEEEVEEAEEEGEEAEVETEAPEAVEEEEEEGAVASRKGEQPHEQEGLVEVEEDEEIEDEDEVEIAEIEDEDEDVSDILDADLDKEER